MAEIKSSSCGMGSDYNEHSQVQRQAFEHFWPWLEDALVNNTSLLPFQTSQLAPISYVDYGCGGGANAALPFQSIKKVLEETGFSGRVRVLQSPVCNLQSRASMQRCEVRSLVVYTRICMRPPSKMDEFAPHPQSYTPPETHMCCGWQDGSSHLQVTLVDVPSNDWNKVVEVFFKPGAVGCAEAILPSLVPKSFYAGEVVAPGSLHIGVTVDALHWLSHAPPHGSKDSICYLSAGMSLCTHATLDLHAL